VRKTITLLALGLALLGAALYGAYSLGAGAERQQHELEFAAIRSEYAGAVAVYDIRLAGLRRALDESANRADGISRRLDEAVRIAGRATDRNQRIAVLIGAIKAALDGLRAEP